MKMLCNHIDHYHTSIAYYQVCYDTIMFHVCNDNHEHDILLIIINFIKQYSFFLLKSAIFIVSTQTYGVYT